MARGCQTILFALLILGALPFAAEASPQGTGALFENITPRVEEVIERTAVVVYRHIAQARSAIRRNAPEEARRELGAAEVLIETIRENLSTAVAKDLIGIARKHLEYQPTKRVLWDLLLIKSALDRSDIYIPTENARRHLDRVKEFLEKDDKDGAARELAAADRSLVTIEVELPLLMAEKYVLMARHYLAGKNAEKADEALRIAEQQAQGVFLVIRSPLNLAKKEVRLANRLYSEGKFAEAGAALGRAEAFLKRAKIGATTSEKKQVSILSDDVADLERKIDIGDDEVEAVLKSAWEKSVALVERWAESLAAFWLKNETPLVEENALIETKLHVGFAATYQLTTGEPEKAARELDEAVSFLKKAMNDKLADKAAVKKMGDIEKAILYLKANPGKSDAVLDRYEWITEELSGLIRDL